MVYIYIYTVESRYVKLGLLEISVKSKFFWGSVLSLVLFNLIYSSYLRLCMWNCAALIIYGFIVFWNY